MGGKAYLLLCFLDGVKRFSHRLTIGLKGIRDTGADSDDVAIAEKCSTASFANERAVPIGTVGGQIFNVYQRLKIFEHNTVDTTM